MFACEIHPLTNLSQVSLYLLDSSLIYFPVFVDTFFSTDLCMICSAFLFTSFSSVSSEETVLTVSLPIMQQSDTQQDPFVYRMTFSFTSSLFKDLLMKLLFPWWHIYHD